MGHAWVHAAIAAGAALSIATAGALAADRYEIDPRHSFVEFSVDRFGFNRVIAGFSDVTGALTLDEAAPENSAVEARIGVASLASGDAERDEHVTGARWLNAGAFPDISFRSTSVTRTGEATAEVAGELTLLGRTRPVMLSVRMNRIGPDPSNRRQAAGFSATAVVKRSEFGLETAAALVGDDVEVRLEILAHKTE